LYRFPDIVTFYELKAYVTVKDLEQFFALNTNE